MHAVRRPLLSALLALAGFVVAVPPGRAAAEEGPITLETRITQILEAQAKAWNAGDIDTFMESYWKSDQLTFSAGGTTTRGWAETKANYQRRYPTRERMGRLTFERLEVMPLGESAALVLGRWQLDRSPDSVGGNFSLVFRQFDGRWLIVHDHTSRTE